jgi:hypothetical protein
MMAITTNSSTRVNADDPLMLPLPLSLCKSAIRCGLTFYRFFILALNWYKPPVAGMLPEKNGCDIPTGAQNADGERRPLVYRSRHRESLAQRGLFK